MRDLENEHVSVPRFREDRARAKLLRSHFQEASPVPVLIKKKLRLDEIAEGGRRVALQRHTNAAFALNEAG